MIRVAIIDQDRHVTPESLTTVEQLRTAIESARRLIAECERRLAALSPAPPKRGGVPYMS
jgi:hypothetical protein